MTEDFSKIVHSTKKIVLSAIQNYLAERFYFAIDDVVQETYLRAYKSLQKNQFKGESSLSTYLYTIAKNESLRMNEKLAREEKKKEKLLDKQLTEEKFFTEEKISKEYILSKILSLPKKYSDVLKLYLFGESESSIASSLGIEKGTVKSRTFRAKEKLRKVLLQGDKG
jgi:RNA polymerase sigma-70 factor (ECF subfamily)